jgi:glutathione S-transferase
MDHGRRLYDRRHFPARLGAQSDRFYGARDLVEFDSLERLPAWLERCLARPAVQRGLDIPKRPG